MTLDGAYQSKYAILLTTFEKLQIQDEPPIETQIDNVNLKVRP